MAEKKAPETKREEGREMQRPSRGRGLAPFEDIDRFFDRVFDEFIPRRWLSPSWDLPAWGRVAPFEGRWPRVDIVDRDNDVVVHAELPGVRKEDLDVSLSENTVTIKGTSQREEEKGEGEYYRRELSRGSFSRTLALPAEVDESKAKATFKEGILELVLPKSDVSKRRSIPVE